MAGYSIRVELDGFEPVAQFLVNLSHSQLDDLGIMAGKELVKISREAFFSEKDPVDGSSWKARVSKREGGSILHNTSRLMKSVKIPRRRYLGYQKEWPERFMRNPEARRLFT